MQPAKDQYFMFSEVELSLIKNTFADNDDLLYAVRNVLLQFPLSPAQKSFLASGINKEVIAVLKKRIYPTLSGEFPLTQLPSLLTTLTENLKVLSPKEMAPHFASKQLQMAYLEQQFKALETQSDDEQEIKLSDMARLDGKTIEEQFIDMTAYLFLLGYIDPMLGMIKSLAGSKDESPEDQKKRLTRDSAK